MPERRYDDQETAAIFRAAAEGQETRPRDVSHDEGLSLVELQAIGREVGIAPEAVAQAARALDTRGEARSRFLLGLPIGVSRTVELHRRMSDEEWERLVVQLREVFQARGHTRSDGALRQWTNGNLHVLLEPSGAGHRLRLGTLNSVARSYIFTGLTFLGAAAVLAIAESLGGGLANELRTILVLSVAGVGMVAGGALRLPGWARLRSRQMEDLAAQVAGTEPAGPRLPPASPSAQR